MIGVTPHAHFRSFSQNYTRNKLQVQVTISGLDETSDISRSTSPHWDTASSDCDLPHTSINEDLVETCQSGQGENEGGGDTIPLAEDTRTFVEKLNESSPSPPPSLSEDDQGWSLEKNVNSVKDTKKRVKFNDIPRSRSSRSSSTTSSTSTSATPFIRKCCSCKAKRIVELMGGSEIYDAGPNIAQEKATKAPNNTCRTQMVKLLIINGVTLTDSFPQLQQKGYREEAHIQVINMYDRILPRTLLKSLGFVNKLMKDAKP